MAHSRVATPDDSTTVYKSRSSFEDVEEGAPMLAYPKRSTSLPRSEDGPPPPWSAGETPYHDVSIEEGGRMDEEKDNEPILPTHHKSGLQRRMNQLRFLLILLPSFIARRLGYHSDVKPARRNETSYLNGLRGIAAVIVVIQHSHEEYYPENHGCYGAGPPEQDHYIQLPFLRLITNGSFAVALFFVISGFALSYSPLKQIHAGNAEAAIAAMPSSVLRRPIRLYLPILPVYALSWILIQLQSMWVIYTPNLIPAQPNIFSEFWVGFLGFLIVDHRPYMLPPYFPQGWTLPEEFTGSMLLFLCCLAFARTSTRVRVIGVSIVAAHQFHLGEWIGFLFLFGMLLAELRHVKAKRKPLSPAYRRILAVGWALMLYPALFFGSWPYLGVPAQCVGFRHFAHITHGGMTQVRFFLALAGAAFILILENLPPLQWVFNTSPALYLGDISYSLYLAHWLFAQGWAKIAGQAMLLGGYSKLSACLTAVGLTLFLGIWLSDILWRLSDAQAVRFARWTAKRLGV